MCGIFCIAPSIAPEMSIGQRLSAAAAAATNANAARGNCEAAAMCGIFCIAPSIAPEMSIGQRLSADAPFGAPIVLHKRLVRRHLLFRHQPRDRAMGFSISCAISLGMFSCTIGLGIGCAITLGIGCAVALGIE